MHRFIDNTNNLLFKLINYIIVFYQIMISPLLPARCRYYPTCSHYGKQALAWHGVWSGSWLLLKRLGRCQPWGGHGVDFVPLPMNSYIYHYVPVKKLLSVATVYRSHYHYAARLNYLLVL